MVLLGGLEIVAAGYLLNEFNKDKIDARNRRKHSNRPHSNRPSGHHHHHSSSSENSSDEHRPSRPRPHRPQNGLLNVPNSGPLRPSSAPPINPIGPVPVATWPMPNPNFNGPPSQQWQSQARPNPGPQQGPYQSQTFSGSTPRPSPQPFPQPNFNQPQNFQQPPNAPPGYHLNHSQTVNPSLTANRPPSHSFSGPPPSQTFPLNPPSQATGPRPPIVQQKPGNIYAHIPPGTYIDTKTGRVQHNLYPPDHPMARGIGGTMDDTDLEMLNAGRHTIRNELEGDNTWRGIELERVRDRRGSWTRERRRDSSEDMAYGKSYERRRSSRDRWD